MIVNVLWTWILFLLTHSLNIFPYSRYVTQLYLNRKFDDNILKCVWWTLKTFLVKVTKTTEDISMDLFIVGSPSLFSVGRLLTRWALGFSQWAISAHQPPTASDTPLKAGPLVSSSRGRRILYGTQIIRLS